MKEDKVLQGQENKIIKKKRKRKNINKGYKKRLGKYKAQ